MSGDAGARRVPVGLADGQQVFRHQRVLRTGEVQVCTTSLPAEQCACGHCALMSEAAYAARYRGQDPEAPVPWRWKPASPARPGGAEEAGRGT